MEPERRDSWAQMYIQIADFHLTLSKRYSYNSNGLIFIIELFHNERGTIWMVSCHAQLILFYCRCSSFWTGYNANHGAPAQTGSTLGNRSCWCGCYTGDGLYSFAQLAFGQVSPSPPLNLVLKHLVEGGTVDLVSSHKRLTDFLWRRLPWKKNASLLSSCEDFWW